MLLSPGKDLAHSQMNLLDNMVHTHSLQHTHAGLVCGEREREREREREFTSKTHSPHFLSLALQNGKNGDNGSYVVSGYWDTGVPFLSALNEETQKCT